MVGRVWGTLAPPLRRIRRIGGRITGTPKLCAGAVLESILLAEHPPGTLPGGMEAWLGPGKLLSDQRDQNTTLSFEIYQTITQHVDILKNQCHFVFWISPGGGLPTVEGVGKACGPIGIGPMGP